MLFAQYKQKSLFFRFFRLPTLHGKNLTFKIFIIFVVNFVKHTIFWLCYSKIRKQSNNKKQLSSFYVLVSLKLILTEKVIYKKHLQFSSNQKFYICANMKRNYIELFVALFLFPCIHSKTFNVEQQLDNNG